MHERSLVRRLLQQVESVLDDNHADSAKSIEVEIGPMSGVEPELVRLAFEQIASESRWSDTELAITESSLVIRCSDCQSETKLENFVFRCGQCNSGRVDVIQGDALRLMSVTVEEIDDQLNEASIDQEIPSV